MNAEVVRGAASIEPLGDAIGHVCGCALHEPIDHEIG
jgi:hypothetical protein